MASTLIVSHHPFGWDVLHLFPHLVAEDIYNATTPHGKDVGDLVQYMDTNPSWPQGLLEKWSREYVRREATPLLTTVIPHDNRLAWSVLEDPYEYFRQNDGLRVRELVQQKFSSYVNRGSEEYIKRAMIAHIELGCKNYSVAANEAQFALCEWILRPNFGHLLEQRDPRASEALFETERQRAVLLISILETIGKQAIVL